jgi:HEAT repeat protein
MRVRHLLWLALALAAGCGKDQITQDVSAVRTADAPGRQAAALRLAGKTDPRIAPALAAALGDVDRDVRCAAARSLGTQPAAEAVPPLLALLASHGPGFDCTYEPLGQLRDARAALPLLAAVRGGSAPALTALGAMGPVAIPALIDLLRNETDPRRAEEYARRLVAAGGKDALQPLLQLLSENDRRANANAALALGLLGDPQALAPLVKAADAGIGSAPAALTHMGPAGLQDVIARLERPQLFQRNMAQAALAQANPAELMALLERDLQSVDDAAATRSAHALVWLANTTASPLQASAEAALEKAWTRGDTRTVSLAVDYYLPRHADGEDLLIDALEMHGDEHLATALLNAPSPTLRAAGAEWARQRGVKPVAAAAETPTE